MDDGVIRCRVCDVLPVVPVFIIKHALEEKHLSRLRRIYQNYTFDIDSYMRSLYEEAL